MTITLITGHQCRFCDNLVPDSIAPELGSDWGGYICPDCLIKEREGLARLGKELTALGANSKEGPGRSPYPCARCQKKGFKELFLHQIDGENALLCPKCSNWYMHHNRRQIQGTIAEWALKLK